jgi:hypothetical protein
MGLFEEHPWLLVPLILVVTVAYDLAKTALVGAVRRSRTRLDQSRTRTS